MRKDSSYYRFGPLGTYLIVLFLVILSGNLQLLYGQMPGPVFHFEISFEPALTNAYHVSMRVENWKDENLHLKMPAWMPGYYQIMDYGQYVDNLTATDNTKHLEVQHPDKNSWEVKGLNGNPVTIKYTIKTIRKFVANSYVDDMHAYLVPGNTFLYVPEYLNQPVTVKLNLPDKWKNVATGLKPLSEEQQMYIADDFDVLYDCPILIGNLESLPTFNVQGIPHHFIGYEIGRFDHLDFIEKLEKIVQQSVEIIREIPYDQYTFIAIGPGRGGIEHGNNTTISFSGNNLDSKERMVQMMNFLAHEYFHHYNVKRIRPFELGPFDYENGSRTNMLWISEGLTVYYEYLIVKRAGLVDLPTFLSFFDNHINTHQTDSGRHFQSLQQASYNTWSDGPFGNNRKGPDRAISFYNKGPIVGLILDMEIRNSTNNEKSLDDVMRHLYNHYYKLNNRGFTEAEFQRTCEIVAGHSLDEVFEYVYTTMEFDYNKYLKYAGLFLDNQLLEKKDGNMENKYQLKIVSKRNELQSGIFKSWVGE